MRHTLPLLALAAAANAATYTYTANFDNVGYTAGAVTPPYVGNATLSITSGSALADGNYAWTTLLSNYGMTFNATFTLADNSTVTFTQGEINVTFPGGEPYPYSVNDVNVQLVLGQFYFTNSTAEEGQETHPGSANFIDTVTGWVLSTEPVNNNSFSTYRNADLDSPLYTFGPSWVVPEYYFGAYGGSTAFVRNGGVIPEPSTYGLILGGLALAGAAIRRKKISK